MSDALAGKRILLVIGGGIAAYKCLELIRRARERGASVTCVTTRAAEEFVTPLSLSSLSGEKVYRDLFDLTDEAEMGHIQLSRAADLVVVDGEDGEWLCERPRLDAFDGHRQARAHRAGDERPDVGARRDTTQPRHVDGRRRSGGRPQ